MKGNRLKTIIMKLNQECRGALEAAIGLCVERTHYEVEIEHVLLMLLADSKNDVQVIALAYAVDGARLMQELAASLNHFSTGNHRAPVFSPRLLRMLEEAWCACTLEFQEPFIRSGHLLLALLSQDDLAALTLSSAPQLKRISATELQARFVELGASSTEAIIVEPANEHAAPSTSALKQFTIDLTDKARCGALDPVHGRDEEVRQMLDILGRRRQNNPILAGDAGVGKTAIVEGLALRIAVGDVPPPLRGVMLLMLNLTSLQAGTGVRGEFEQRLDNLIAEIKQSPQPIILFIDEAHMLIGAGGAAGHGDAANQLKPALARGELRTIAATTWSEYKQIFESDAALARRFQVIKVEEPGVPATAAMLRSLVAPLEKHHGVRVRESGVLAAAQLSERYLTGRQLPEKAVAALDSACARAMLTQMTRPGALVDIEHDLLDVDAERQRLCVEQQFGIAHDERLQALKQTQSQLEERRAALLASWERARTLWQDIRAIDQQVEAVKQAQLDGDTRGSLSSRRAALLAELQAVQGETPLLTIEVDARVVAEVIASWSGIPVGRIVRDEADTLLKLDGLLSQRVMGQDPALEIIGRRVRAARAGLEDPGKPLGVFLLVGPSGVGKTETALALSDLLFGGEKSLVVINMSEFKEAHTVSTLRGAPAGYVGYGKGGVLTEAVRRRPYCVLLLDEIEKAHPDVREVFYQVFDTGVMDDAEGRRISFKNTLIIMTSNVASDTITRLCEEDATVSSAQLREAAWPELEDCFAPAFLGRTTVVPYARLSEEIIRRIVIARLKKLDGRLQTTYGAQLVYEDAVVGNLSARCTAASSGARNVELVITQTLAPEIARLCIARTISGERISEVRVRSEKSGEISIEASP